MCACCASSMCAAQLCSISRPDGAVVHGVAALECTTAGGTGSSSYPTQGTLALYCLGMACRAMLCAQPDLDVRMQRDPRCASGMGRESGCHGMGEMIKCVHVDSSGGCWVWTYTKPCEAWLPLRPAHVSCCYYSPMPCHAVLHYQAGVLTCATAQIDKSLTMRSHHV